MYPCLVVLAITTSGCAASSAARCATSPEAVDTVPTGEAPTGGSSAGEDLSALSDEQVVRKMMKVTGAADIGKQVADKMLESFRNMPDLPPRFVERLSEQLRPETLTDMVVPIYLKHYDRETLIAAIHFYQSEQGQVLIKKLPAVTAESTEAGRAWGQAIATQTLKDLGVEVGPAR